LIELLKFNIDTKKKKVKKVGTLEKWHWVTGWPLPVCIRLTHMCSNDTVSGYKDRKKLKLKLRVPSTGTHINPKYHRS
jgi:hypothetical protein